MTIVYIIIAIIVVILAIVVVAALAYAVIVFHHDHRWARMKSDKYDMYNEEAETCERTRQ